MAAYLEIGNDYQSPRISFTLDLSQTDTSNEDRQSPRISFSLNLSQTDRISQENRKREGVADVSYDTDFEFCLISSNNNDDWNSIIGETLLPVADELFVDGKIRPLIHAPLKAQPVTIVRHLSPEISSCRSPVRSTSSTPLKITNSCWGNAASKSLCQKPPSKWNEIMFKLSNNENARAENRRTPSKVVDRDESGNNVKQQVSPIKSLWPFSRSCNTGREMKGNGLSCSLPFSRIQSTAERKYKAATSKDIESLPGLVEGSKPVESRRMSNKVQPDPRCISGLKPRFEAEDGKVETKVKQTSGSGKLGSPGSPAPSRIRGSIRSQRPTGRVGGNGRLLGRKLERSSTTAAKADSFGSPPPGKPMAEGSLFVKANNSMGGVRVSPVVNVSVCIGHTGGSWNGGGGLFGFFSKRGKKRPTAYPHHHSHASTNRKVTSIPRLII